MRVRLVSITEAAAARAAGAPALTPEMLAAVGARYSRNDEGLEQILALVDRSDPDKAVDSIFRMVDYGHQSIADMTPVPMFMDGVSLWLIYHVWAYCLRASGQESSTRYIRFDGASLVAPELSGVPEELLPEWRTFIDGALDRYRLAAAFWEAEALRDPDQMRLPPSLLDESSRDAGGKAAKMVARMRRNFVFDRARYWLPSAAVSNFMLLMAARDWVGLAQDLLSHPLPEARHLGTMIGSQLGLSAPRLIRHAKETGDWVAGHAVEVAEDAALAGLLQPVAERNRVATPVSVDLPCLPGMPPRGSLSGALSHHPHRYSWVGREARRIHARYGIDAVAFAELRDLNRHRTGYKYAPFIPVGFYGARDQLVRDASADVLAEAVEFGLSAAERQRGLAASGDASHPYWSLLGTQVPFEHGTSLDKMIYEIELRTGTGAHYRYAEHMRGVHDQLVEALPELSGRILLGSAEPE